MGKRTVSRAENDDARLSRTKSGGSLASGHSADSEESARTTSGTGAGFSAAAPGTAQTTPRNRGLGMLIITAYGIFAVSAFARAFYQIMPFPQAEKVQFADAPLALSLSAFAAAVYILATLALARTSAAAWKVALVAVLIEMAGVIGVGTWTLLQPELFEVATVWGFFGRDYGYIPLVLPFIGLFWLFRHRLNRS
ncbi:hypothetical protein [Nesterenkonia ebinurensis]|uniref:hypothetical protein n=1 Tax=Nesterenkonia ebinurensis TaxID=2608252 RepID=UPI001CC61D7B|nr:hypothetical protein [Nesterenkonia ebinurensis]